MLRLFGPQCTPAPVDPAKVDAIPAGPCWIDLLSPTREEEKLVEQALGQNVPTRAELQEIEPSSRLYARKGALFMTASVLHGLSGDQPDTDPVGFILTDTMLVTVRYIDPKPFATCAEELQAEPDLAGDPASMLLKLLDAIIDRLADELESTGRQIETVSSQVFVRKAIQGRQNRATELRLEAILLRIGAVQRLLAEIRESAVSTNRMLGFLRSSGRFEANGHARQAESLQGDLTALLDHSYFLAENLTFLLDASLGLISLEQNFVMKLFSVVAVVLMPPTLIAGIYGMNFKHMPELEWLYGYPMAIGLILASAILPYWFARRRRWL